VRDTETEEAEKKGVERLEAVNRRKSRGKPPGEAQLANNLYVIVITSLREVDAYLIPELYRFRRQRELVFKVSNCGSGITGYRHKRRHW
jgi:hypothetical protein